MNDGIEQYPAEKKRIKGDDLPKPDLPVSGAPSGSDIEPFPAVKQRMKPDDLSDMIFFDVDEESGLKTVADNNTNRWDRALQINDPAHDSHNHLYHYFLLHFFFTMATEFYKDDWANVPFYSNLPCHILQRELFDKYDEYRFEQLKKMSAVHKLTYKFGEKKLSETIYEYLMRK